MSNEIKRVAVFSTAQRVTHWLTACSIIFLLTGGWLIQHSDVDAVSWLDWHIMIGQALSVVLAYRVYLLFKPGSGHWRLLIPSSEQRHIVLQTIKFYASLGRLPCPDWYAFNPLWQPVYLAFIVITILTTISGYMIAQYLFPLGYSLAEWHAIFASIILYFTLAHFLFSILHDVKGSGAQISAMLNGFKYFQIKNVSTPLEENSVSIKDLLKK